MSKLTDENMIEIASLIKVLSGDWNLPVRITVYLPDSPNSSYSDRDIPGKTKINIEIYIDGYSENLH